MQCPANFPTHGICTRLQTVSLRRRTTQSLFYLLSLLSSIVALVQDYRLLLALCSCIAAQPSTALAPCILLPMTMMICPNTFFFSFEEVVATLWKCKFVGTRHALDRSVLFEWGGSFQTFVHEILPAVSFVWVRSKISIPISPNHV